MAKKKRTRKKNDFVTNDLKNVAIVVLIGLLLFFAYDKGWLDDMFSRESKYDHGDSLPFPHDVNPDKTILLEVTPNNICAGDSATGKITTNINNGACRLFLSVNYAEWTKYKDVRLDRNGNYQESNVVNSPGFARFVTVCCDANFNCGLSNEASLTVQDCDSSDSSPPSYNVGDSVGGGTGSGSLIGDEGNSISFDLSGVSPGGDCYIGAEIYTEWDYDDYQSCYTLGGVGQGLEWFFTDSSGIVWSVVDHHPNTNNVNLCPLFWDGRKEWKLWLSPLYDLPGCKINYRYKVDLYICECK